jgi:hypothetical protein
MNDLTGKRRYRLGGFFRRKLILQVEYRWHFDVSHYGDRASRTAWRDAKVEDLMTIQACHTPFPIAERDNK